jgi:hypothetical protein
MSRRLFIEAITRSVLLTSVELLFLKSLAFEFQRAAVSVTVRTTWSEAPEGISAAISNVTVTVVPTKTAR